MHHLSLAYHARIALQALGALCLLWLAAACQEAPAQITDVVLVGDATEGYGPYQITARLNRAAQSGDMVLRWSAEPSGQQGEVLMRPISADRATWSGAMEAPEQADAGETQRPPFPLGTTFSYWIEYRAAGQRAVSPPQAPQRQHSFEVGPARQPMVAQELSPARGPSLGGTLLFLRGHGLRPDTQVLFDGTPAARVTYRTAHLLEVITPPMEPGEVSLTLTREGLTPQAQAPTFFAVPPPSVEAVEPDEGPTRGGTPLRIQGRGFQPGARVFLGEAEASAVAWGGQGALRAISPPHPPGAVTVTVLNPDQQRGELPQGYTYWPPPALLAVDPPIGPIQGGNEVVVTGAGFRPGVSLTFNGRLAVVLESTDNTLRVRVPPGQEGSADLVATNPDGQQGLGPGLYTYLGPPRLLQVVPDRGLTLGGERVDLLGENFFTGMEATLDGQLCAALRVQSPRQATCLTPPHDAGVVDVAVQNVDGQRGELPQGFTYVPPPPVILSVEPGQGTDLGGTLVLVRVRYGQPGARLLFGDELARATGLSVEGEELVYQVLTPPGPEGLVDVSVLNPDGQGDNAPDAYRYLGPPRLEAVEPPRGPDTGGQEVLLLGDNLTQDSLVLFGGQPAQVLGVDPDTGGLRVRTPPGALGPVDVSVTHPDGRGDTLEDGYEYILAPPSITDIEPPRGPTWGSNEVLLTGNGFRPGLLLRVDGALVEPLEQTSTRVLFVAPAHEEGTVQIEVQNFDGQSDAAAYTYVLPSLHPDGGLITGFTTVEVRGEGLDEDTVVTFGGRLAEEIIYVSPRLLRAISPPGAVGAADVTVTTRQGLGELLPGAFAYRVFADVTQEVGLPQEEGCLEAEAHDIDQDGDLDLVLANGGVFQAPSDSVPNTLYRNQNGRLVPEALLPADNSMNIDFADIDEDGDPDMLIANLDGFNRLYRNEGGRFVEITQRLPVQRASYDAGFFDANGDGRPDILLVNTSEPENLFLNAGGVFTNDSGRLRQSSPSEHDHDATFGDINGDGVQDVLLSVDNTIEGNGVMRYQAVNRFLVSGPGVTFSTELDTPLTPLRGDYLDARFADVNGDGLQDVITVDNLDLSSTRRVPGTDTVRNGVHLYLGLPGGGLREAAPGALPDLEGPAVSLGLADLDQDGDVDLTVAVAVHSGDLRPGLARGQLNWLLINRGDGTFVQGQGVWPAHRDVSFDIEAMDVDLDGLPDLYICNYLTPNRLYVQTSTP